MILGISVGKLGNILLRQRGKRGGRKGGREEKGGGERKVIQRVRASVRGAYAVSLHSKSSELLLETWHAWVPALYTSQVATILHI